MSSKFCRNWCWFSELHWWYFLQTILPCKPILQIKVWMHSWTRLIVGGVKLFFHLYFQLCLAQSFCREMMRNFNLIYAVLTIMSLHRQQNLAFLHSDCCRKHSAVFICHGQYQMCSAESSHTSCHTGTGRTATSSTSTRWSGQWMTRVAGLLWSRWRGDVTTGW